MDKSFLVCKKAMFWWVNDMSNSWVIGKVYEVWVLFKGKKGRGILRSNMRETWGLFTFLLDTHPLVKFHFISFSYDAYDSSFVCYVNFGKCAYMRGGYGKISLELCRKFQPFDWIISPHKYKTNDDFMMHYYS